MRFLYFAIVCMVPSVAFGQSANRIHVNDPRPLKAAIDELEVRMGVPINYEDPRFASPGDIRDVTESVQSPAQRLANPHTKIFVPVGGALDFDLGPISNTSTIADAMPLLTYARMEHEASGFPGRFIVKSVSNVATVEPSQNRSVDGHWKPVTPAMEIPISFRSEQRNAADILKLIVKTMSNRLGIEVGLGRFPFVAFCQCFRDVWRH